MLYRPSSPLAGSLGIKHQQCSRAPAVLSHKVAYAKVFNHCAFSPTSTAFKSAEPDTPAEEIASAISFSVGHNPCDLQ